MEQAGVSPENNNGGEHKKSFIDIKGFSEAMRKENLGGTWTIEQLKEMENEFNNLPIHDEKQRKFLLYRFFNASIIIHIIIDKFTLVSEYAYRKDLFDEQFDGMRRSQLISKALSPFSVIRFGPSCENEEPPLHDAHVKTFVLSEIPPAYQRRYPNEPALLASLERCADNQALFQISVEHLVPVEGFCKCCVGHKHRQTLQAIPLSKITSIRLCPKENGYYDLVIETT